MKIIVRGSTSFDGDEWDSYKVQFLEDCFHFIDIVSGQVVFVLPACELEAINKLREVGLLYQLDD